MNPILRGGFLRKRRQPRILCHFNHFYGIGSRFEGKSTTAQPEHRARIVSRALDRIRTLAFDVDVRVCGFPESSLLPIDLDLSAINEPQHIVYASIERMLDALDQYDYFLNIEDDILITGEVLTNSIAFMSSAQLNEVYLPNRMERLEDGTLDCVDMHVVPGWQTTLHREFQGTSLGVAFNPHSGLSFLSREQLRYAAGRVDLSHRERIVGGFMASAYANLHAPFLLWRARSNLLAHHVVHLDRWLASSPISEQRPDRARRLVCGHLDAVVKNGAVLKICGWAVAPDDQPATEFRLAIDNHEVPNDCLSVTRVKRPDVVHVYPDTPLECGFELAFHLRTLFTLLNGSAPQRIAVGFRGAPCDHLWTLPPVVPDIGDIIGTMPQVPDAPFMPGPVVDRLVELMHEANCYLEYGTGGTTIKAREIGIPTIVAVESDALWLEGVRHKSAQGESKSRCQFIHVDIGPTGAWGVPVSEAHWKSYHRYALQPWEVCREQAISPDLVLIDGRFRVACSLATVLFAKPGCRILIDDYFDRPHYAVIEAFVRPEQRVCRAVEFIVPHEMPRDVVWQSLCAAASDSR